MIVTKSARALARFNTRQQNRWNSNESMPLFIWLGDNNDADQQPLVTKLLLPTRMPRAVKTIQTPTEILHGVQRHYQTEHQFVGGMGENDRGVWFASVSSTKDTLEFDVLLQESIQAIKEERHGVPLGAYTSGLCIEPPNMALTEIGLDSIQVSLWAGNPVTYQQMTGLDARAFGQVCGFIADAAEQGMAVEVGVSSKADVGAARDLAISLGARDVHVYKHNE